ncbi:hypothetical protein I79_010395 [Cricetulus griseus]|uniref:Secreted protein n=1 Tax=Cricetulus griseus TaxID=10029 RepID=G3HID4_CRIGR|nr:hypothetical protein I79_010395 [Cricetulus griseus]
MTALLLELLLFLTVYTVKSFTGFGIKMLLSQAVVAHAISPSNREAEAGRFCEFEAILVYKATEKPCLEKPKNTNKKREHITENK